MWFEELTGFREESPDQVRANLQLDGNRLISRVNGRAMTWGRLETPTLGELRQRVAGAERPAGRISIREVVASAHDLHADSANASALFQVASQFNLLEMLGPHKTPEDGVGIYQFDPTQGPVCAIAAGAGTIYRNYFAATNGRIGQSEHNQIDCLADLGQALGNHDQSLWRMRNGYALPTPGGLATIATQLDGQSESQRDRLRQLLRIGLQWDTEVTLPGAGHTVSQAYCSALPIAYSGHPPEAWRGFAQLVLEATYEATFAAAALNGRLVFLTLVGGGAFGNPQAWILAAIARAVRLYADTPLDVAIVSHRSSNAAVRELVRLALED